MELENFRDAILQKPADIVTLRQGVDTLEVADAILAASRTARRSPWNVESGFSDQSDTWLASTTWRGSASEVTVVGLGKIGLPLAVQIAGKGFRVHGVVRLRLVL